MTARVLMFLFLAALPTWYWWAAWGDWRRRRVPVAILLRTHYTTASDAPAVFWGLTVLRVAAGVLLTWKAADFAINLVNAR